MSKTARSIEELFPVIGYARAGDLKSIKTWIDAGSPINLPPGKKTRRQSPLQIAIESGFLTLTEMLLEGGADFQADSALWHAVNHGRADIAQLLLDRGANVGEVLFEDVCRSRNFDLIKLFLERGADPVDGEPFFHALCSGLQPLLGLFKELLAKDPRLQPQADGALGYYAEKKNARGVALMIWAGAKPDAELGDGASYCGGTPLEVAAQAGDLALLKSMKPEKYPSLLPRMIKAAAFGESEPVTHYLLSLGAPLNDEEDGSSSLLSLALWRVGRSSEPGYSLPNAKSVEQQIIDIETLLSKGAKLPPTDARSLRRTLSSMGPHNLVHLLEVLRRQAAFSPEFLVEVISTPKLKERLGNRWAEAKRKILCEVAKTAEAATEVAQEAEPRPKPLPDIAELRARAEDALVAIMRNNEHPHFLERAVSKQWTRGEFRRRLRMPDHDERNEESVLREACRTLGKRLKSVDLVVETQEYRSFAVPIFRLHPDATWEQAVREVCSLDEAAPLPLTSTATRLLNFLETAEPAWIPRQRLAKRLGCNHYVKFETGLCEELKRKRGIEVSVDERRQQGSPHEQELLLKIVSRTTPSAVEARQTITRLVWDVPMDKLKKLHLDRFRSVLFDFATRNELLGAEPFYLFKVHTADALAKVFPRLALERYGTSGRICDLLRAVRLPDALRLAFDLQDSATEWWAALVPAPSWEVAQQAIRRELEMPTLEQQFGLSADAARLLTWIESRRPKEMLGTWTPVVETSIEKEIGFEADWPEENLPALLRMLVDEINDKTTYQLDLVPWKHGGDVLTRVKVERKKAAKESLAEAVARLAKEKGVRLSEDQLLKVAAALEDPASKKE